MLNVEKKEERCTMYKPQVYSAYTHRLVYIEETLGAIYIEVYIYPTYQGRENQVNYFISSLNNSKIKYFYHQVTQDRRGLQLNLVVIDKLIKVAHLLPTRETATTSGYCTSFFL